MAKPHTRDQAPQHARVHDTSKPLAAGPGKEGKHGRRRKSKGQKLLLSPRPEWHTHQIPRISIPSDARTVSPQLVDKIYKHAQSILDEEAARYLASHQQSSSSYDFMSTVMSSGTWTDKVSALTLVVQESPLHTLKAFENLVGLAGKRSRSQALLALEALKDMLTQGNVLPTDRKLRMFTKQPELLAALQGVNSSWTSDDVLPGGLTEQHLILWIYEDQLKTKYFDLLKILETWGNDEVEFSRLRAVTFVWELLKDKPEQEENLLRLLVNKLGDTSKKVASKASHLLLQLQVAHPSMRSIVISAIESDILMRPGQSSNAKYYGVITLNQTILQISDPSVPNKLLDVYFSLFVAILNRSKRPEAPASVPEKDNDAKKKRKRNTKQTQNVSKPEQELEEKIIAQILTGINRAFPFSKKDSGAFEKHLDTMFKITHSSNFNTSVQALVLIQRITSTHHISTDRYLRTLYESLLDPRLIHSSKHTMYLNLLYRSLKADASLRRVKAFVKRILQIMELHEPSFICALLYLVIELQNLFPGVRAMVEHPEVQDEDEEEAFADVPESDDKDTTATDGVVGSSISTTRAAAKPVTAYDGRKRDPEYSNADRTCVWELTPWTQHYHPSVTLFAAHMSTQSRAAPTGSSTAPARAPMKPDPASHTLMSFLDRFAYRKPRSKPDAALRGTSLMQPALASAETTDTLIRRGEGARAGAAAAAPAPGSESFWARKAADVAPDDVFFHRYFAAVGGPRTGVRRTGRDPEDDGAFAEDEEDEIWRVISGAAQGDDAEEEGESDGDDDDMFDYEDDESDGEDAMAGGGGDGDVDVGAGADSDDDDGGGGGALALEDDDSSALFSSEDEAGGGGASLPPSALDDEEEEDADGQGEGKGRQKKRARRRLKDLPMFGDADDYAALIAKGEADFDGGPDAAE